MTTPTAVSHMHTHTHTPGNGRPCWVSSCHPPSQRSYPGPAEACCCCQSQTTLEDRKVEKRGEKWGGRREEKDIKLFLPKFGEEYARHGAAMLSLVHDLWKYSWAINQIGSAGCTAFESNNSLWLSLYTLLDAFCHLLYCSRRLVELHERNWPFAKEITISRRVGRGTRWK